MGIIPCTDKNTEQIEMLELEEAASTSRTTSPFYRSAKFSTTSCMRPLRLLGGDLKTRPRAVVLEHGAGARSPHTGAPGA